MALLLTIASLLGFLACAYIGGAHGLHMAWDGKTREVRVDGYVIVAATMLWGLAFMMAFAWFAQRAMLHLPAF